MTITVGKLKLALLELRDEPVHGAYDHFAALARNPTALTMLAEKLSERPARVTVEAQKRPALVMDHRTSVVDEITIIVTERDERPLSTIIEHGARASREGW